MPHSVSNILVHLIFSTKDRRRLITAEIRDDLHAYLGGIVREIGGKALTINGIEDHVHLLVRIPSTHSIADVARLIKTNSSRWIHRRWPQYSAFAWQTGYGAFSVSESIVKSVAAYIQHQQHHHTNMSFQDEFRIFLHKNNIALDDRYLWS